MTIVVALHGPPGSGKSTLIRRIGEYLGSNCLSIEEAEDDFLKASSSEDNQWFWFQRTPVICVGDNLAHFFLEKLSVLSVITFTFLVYCTMGTVWPVVVLFIGSLAIARLRRWFSSFLLSKVWACNVSLLFDRERKSQCQWIWRDRTCVDVYAFCLINKATAVPLNMPEILMEQTRSTSVALLFDLPRSIIIYNLRARIQAANATFTNIFFTRLILSFGFFVQEAMDALPLLERWYTSMNVPVIKFSQIKDKLDYDTVTGNIRWTQHSIDALLQVIEQAAEQRGPSCPTIDQSLIPWQIVRQTHLCLP